MELRPLLQFEHAMLCPLVANYAVYLEKVLIGGAKGLMWMPEEPAANTTQEMKAGGVKFNPAICMAPEG